jgi:hypothetical protein
MNHVQPNSWCTAGGNGTIDYYPLGKSVVVSQTPDVQEQVSEFLATLQRAADEKSAHDNEADASDSDWVMEMLPCPAPALFIPWAMFGPPLPPMTALPWCHPERLAKIEYSFIPAPLTPARLPVTMPYCPPAPPTDSALQCAGYEISSQHSPQWTLTAVVEKNGRTKLALGTGNGASLTSERLELKADDYGSIVFGTQGSQVDVAFNGIDAVADSAAKIDHGVVLKGHVRLCNFTESHIHCSRLIDEAEITWKDGQMHFHFTWAKTPTHHAGLIPVRHVLTEEEEQQAVRKQRQ